VRITFEGPDSETMVDKQIDMLSAALAKIRRRSALRPWTARRQSHCCAKRRPPRSPSSRSTPGSTVTFRCPRLQPTIWQLPHWLPIRWPN
jgi:hypothetical protein